MTEINITIDRDTYVDSVFHSINFGGDTQLGLERRMNIYSYIGTVLDPNHFTDEGLVGPDDYINGALFSNLTRGGTSIISDYDALTHTVSLWDSIPGMQKDDLYIIQVFKEKRTFLHWPIGAIPPYSTINSAILNMYVAVAKPYYNNNLWIVGPGEWGEYTLTWDSSLELGLGPMEGVISVDTIGWKTVSVKDAVELWYLYPEYAPNQGIVITGTYDGQEELGAAYFSSRETEEHKPFVIIDYTPPAIIRGTSWIID